MNKNHITPELIHCMEDDYNPALLNKVVEQYEIYNYVNFNLEKIEMVEKYENVYLEPGYWGIAKKGTYEIIYPPVLMFEPRFVTPNEILICKGEGWEEKDNGFKCKGMKWGVTSPNGKEIIPFEYDCLSAYDNYHCAVVDRNLWVYYVAKKDNKWGVINRYSEVVIPFEFDLIMDRIIFDNSNPYFECKKGKNLEIRNSQNEIIIESGKYTWFDDYVYDNTLIASKKGDEPDIECATIIDLISRQELVEPDKYEYINCVDHNLYNAIRVDDDYSILMDKRGQLIADNIKGRRFICVNTNYTKDDRYEYLAYLIDNKNVLFNLDDGMKDIRILTDEEVDEIIED